MTYNTNDERSTLLGNPDSPRKESDQYSSGGCRSSWRRLMDVGIGFAICAVLAMAMGGKHPQKISRRHVERHQTQPSNLRSGDDDDDRNYQHDDDYHYDEDDDKPDRHFDSSETHIGRSKYSRFQAMGFQIYTGGAPALIFDENDLDEDGKPTMKNNSECKGMNSYGHFDDYDTTNETLPSSLWQCYLGHEDPMEDIRHRMEIMRAAVERAHKEANHNSDVLKIFIAPEFFWRGREGAYVFAPNASKPMFEKDTCTEVCQIMMGLEQIVSNKKYKDWLFLFGTVVVSEQLPKEDTYDYLFYNFAPVYKGYDPDMEDHYGKRYLVPKRYVSNVDFLTPVRQYNGNITKEIVELAQKQLALARGDYDQDDDLVRTEVTPTPDDEPIVVQNPFELQRDFYDRDMWYSYKDELMDLGYHMIEYDWLILDNITFTIEVCLDHDARTALNAYLADNVLGSPTRIPKSFADWDPVAQKFVGGVERVKIPRHQAQISLVSSMGMVANPQSLALTNNGTLILQDGQSSKNGTMAYMLDCDTKSWHFDGGSEYISRSTAITNTRIDFKYQIHAPKNQVGVFDNLYDDSDNTWKESIKGVFSTTKYEPKITIYPVRNIAKV